MKVVTAEQMRSLEGAAAATGLAYTEMMERAGQAVAQAIDDAGLAEGARVLALIGPGNNGGDGLVAAYALRALGAEVTCYIWKRKTEDDANLAQAAEAGVTMVRQAEDVGLVRLRALVAECHVLVDALLGTGAWGAPRGDPCGPSPRACSGDASLAELLAALDESLALLQPATEPLRRLDRAGAVYRQRPAVVAVDLPSGLSADTGEADPLTPRADLTVTFAFPKAGLFRFPGAALVGTLQVADIGIPEALAADVALEVADQALVRPLLPARPLDSNKGTFGKAMVVGGSINYTGAPYMAAMGAARAGAGLVTLAIPQPLYPILAACASETTFVLLPSSMGALTPDAVRVLGESFEGYKALLLGPGLGREKDTVEFVRQLLGLKAAGRRTPMGFLARETVEEARSFELPAAVVDADGLNALADTPEWWTMTGAHLVLTPHPGELARLRGTTVEAIQADRVAAALAAAAAWQQTVVLKGAFTVVASADGRATILPFANPALASAGTGDVLAGAIAGFLAQGLPPESAAVVGAYVHGLAGELARDALGEAGVLATDLLPRLPEAIGQVVGG